MLLDKLKQRFGATILAAESAHGQETIVVTRERALELMRALRDEPDFGFNFLADLTAVDWVERTPRFEVVYHLRALGRGGALRVKVGAGEPDLWVYSVTGLWKSADWLERECYDMFASASRAIPTSAASCSTIPSRVIRCAKTIPSTGASRWCPKPTRS